MKKFRRILILCLVLCVALGLLSGCGEKGLPAAAKALSLDETNANAHELYAIACLETARWKEALEHLEYLLSRLHMDTPQYQKLARTAAFVAQMLRAHEPAQNDADKSASQ